MDKFLKKRKDGRFRLLGKNIFLTYPKCSAKKNAVLSCLQEVVSSLEGCLIAEEKHADGTPHVHAVLSLNKKLDTQNARYFDLKIDDVKWHGNYQGCENFKAVLDYCKKNGDTLEWGVLNDYTSKKEVRERSITKKILEGDLAQMVVDEEIKLGSLPLLYKAKNLYEMMTAPKYKLSPRVCLWIKGAPGTGKSAWAANTFSEDVYYKNQNKWWDGYKGESAVIIEDFDYGGYGLGHHLKLWSDLYRATGEIKGGLLPLDYAYLIITSNYTPDEIWNSDAKERPKDPMVMEAISRRFKICVMGSNENGPYRCLDYSSPNMDEIDLVSEMQYACNRITETLSKKDYIVQCKQKVTDAMQLRNTYINLNKDDLLN
jgi:hypothetical protein